MLLTQTEPASIRSAMVSADAEVAREHETGKAVACVVGKPQRFLARRRTA